MDNGMVNKVFVVECVVEVVVSQIKAICIKIVIAKMICSIAKKSRHMGWSENQTYFVVGMV